jgi:hypothetical protein
MTWPLDQDSSLYKSVKTENHYICATSFFFNCQVCQHYMWGSTESFSHANSVRSLCGEATYSLVLGHCAIEEEKVEQEVWFMRLLSHVMTSPSNRQKEWLFLLTLENISTIYYLEYKCSYPSQQDISDSLKVILSSEMWPSVVWCTNVSDEPVASVLLHSTQKVTPIYQTKQHHVTDACNFSCNTL